MRVVLDTNILVSAMLSPGGVCKWILSLVLDGQLTICVDERILAEYQRVLMRSRFHFSESDIGELLQTLRADGYAAIPLPVKTVLPDPDDLPFLEVALSCDALLITGNLKHYPKRKCKNASVLSPREFIECLRKSL